MTRNHAEVLALCLILLYALAGCGTRDPAACVAGWVVATPFVPLGAAPWTIESCQQEIPE